MAEELHNPRFTDDAIAQNRRLADVAAAPAQEIHLAAIPGTRKVERLEEN